ncbi:MAG: hypothetical protein WCN89_05515, partial [bacterium]
ALRSTAKGELTGTSSGYIFERCNIAHCSSNPVDTFARELIGSGPLFRWQGLLPLFAAPTTPTAGALLRERSSKQPKNVK